MASVQVDRRSACEVEIARCRAAARERLERRAGISTAPTPQFRRPAERPFTAAERATVTILFGGLTAGHDRLLQSVFESCGYRAQPLPQPDVAACHVGRYYCNNGLCNPAYFTIGTLIRHLQRLEATGMSKAEIIDRHVFFTAGNCGPCRFGMYESEYRLALRNAGFEGFRVLLFRQNDGVNAHTGEPGLKLTLHFGLGAANALVFADGLQVFGYEVRPYEIVPGLTNRCLGDSFAVVANALARRRPVVVAERAPAWVSRVVGTRRLGPVLAIHDHLWGPMTRATIEACAAPLRDIEVDRLRVKPVVKITGEFWAQTTEGDGNFQMFRFLEGEGAHVLVEPVSSWPLYLLQLLRARLGERRGRDAPRATPVVSRLVARVREEGRLATRRLLIEVGERIYRRHFDRIRLGLGAGRALLDQQELARLADPHYRQLARGGEGHLEVAKSLYYTTRRVAHMVLSLKPFGCMPSTQSDGVQAAMLTRVEDLLFLPIETGPEGELAAQSRVQIALVEARHRAQTEFREALAVAGRPLDDIRRYVDDHPELRRAQYRVPRRAGVAGVAANFVLHVAGRMRRDTRRRRLPGTRAAEGGTR
jgi:predicted nucleotide-binding protein (sugar kinase/HSP70/actin superfamily)